MFEISIYFLYCIQSNWLFHFCDDYSFYCFKIIKWKQEHDNLYIKIKQFHILKMICLKEFPFYN